MWSVMWRICAWAVVWVCTLSRVDVDATCKLGLTFI